jgi:hypothetical protein
VRSNRSRTRRVAWGARALFAFAAAGLPSCGLVFPLDGYSSALVVDAHDEAPVTEGDASPDICGIVGAPDAAPLQPGQLLDCGAAGKIDPFTNPAHCGFCGHACEADCRSSYCTPTPFATLPDAFAGNWSESLVGEADERSLFVQASGYSPLLNTWASIASAVAWDGGIVFTTAPVAGFASKSLRVGDDLLQMTTLHITRMPMDGGGPRFDIDAFTPCSDAGDPCGEALAVGDDQIFFSRGNDVYRVGVDGAGEQIVVADQRDLVDLAADDASAYWFQDTPDGGRAWRSPTRANTPSLTASGPQAVAFTAQGAYVYWVDTNARLMRARKDGGTAELVSVSPLPSTSAVYLHVDGDDVYWSATEWDDAGPVRVLLLKTPRCGGPTRVLFADTSSSGSAPVIGARGLATDAHFLYFGTINQRASIVRVPR